MSNRGREPQQGMEDAPQMKPQHHHQHQQQQLPKGHLQQPPQGQHQQRQLQERGQQPQVLQQLQKACPAPQPAPSTLSQATQSSSKHMQVASQFHKLYRLHCCLQHWHAWAVTAAEAKRQEQLQQQLQERQRQLAQEQEEVRWLGCEANSQPIGRPCPGGPSRTTLLATAHTSYDVHMCLFGSKPCHRGFGPELLLLL